MRPACGSGLLGAGAWYEDGALGGAAPAPMCSLGKVTSFRLSAFGRREEACRHKRCYNQPKPSAKAVFGEACVRLSRGSACRRRGRHAQHARPASLARHGAKDIWQLMSGHCTVNPPFSSTSSAHVCLLRPVSGRGNSPLAASEPAKTRRACGAHCMLVSSIHPLK
jgi:hypothetical protein